VPPNLRRLHQRPNALLMPRFCDLVGHEIAKEILRDSLVREFVVPVLRPVFSVIAQTTVAIKGGDPDDDASAYVALEEMFAPPGAAIAPFDPADFYTLPFDEDPAAFSPNEAQLAQWIACLLGPIARAAMNTSANDNTPHPETPRPRKPMPNSFEEANNVWSTDERTAHVAEELKDDGIFTAAGVAAKSATAGGSGVSPGKFQDFVKALAKFIGRRCPKLNQWLPQAVLTEIATTAGRAAIAKAMAEAATRIPLHLSSSSTIGTHVHRLLEKRYERRFKARRDVVTERWNFATGRPEQAVIGPATGGEPIALGDLVWLGASDTDWFFRCLHMALSSPNLHQETWLRSDLIDRALLSIWEIKPIMSGPSGVWQEAMYRTSFNLVRALLECIGIKPLTGPLVPGNLIPEPSKGGSGGANRTESIATAIDVSKQAGQPALAIPFQVFVLPGLIPYVCFRSPNQGEILEVLALLILAAMNEAAKLGREAGARLSAAAARAMKEAIAAFENWATPENIACALLAIVVVILVVFAVVGSGGAAAGVGAAAGGAGAGTSAAGIGAAGSGLGATIAEAFGSLIVVLRNFGAATRFVPAAAWGVSIGITPNSQPTGRTVGKEPDTTSMHFHGLNIDGLPVSALGTVLEGLGKSLGPVLKDVATRLRTTRKPPTRNV
jgi:hypothetical protein